MPVALFDLSRKSRTRAGKIKREREEAVGSENERTT
jgi:hypothetical protein